MISAFTTYRTGIYAPQICIFRVKKQIFQPTLGCFSKICIIFAPAKTEIVRRKFNLPQGKVLEWLKRHAWKACNRLKRFVGSNPILSANESRSVTNNTSALVFLHSSAGSARTNEWRNPLAKVAPLCWGTRTRTRKDRTRICSVANYTIPQTGEFLGLRILFC